jgi:hypothetical protein
MSEIPKYKCRSCGANFKADRWPECTNCNEPVPPEIRALYPDSVYNRIPAKPDISAPSRGGSRPPRRTTRQERNQARDVAEHPTQSFDPSSQISADARAIITSQNKTTFAVRSLALYLFITLQSGLFGGGMITLAINNKSNYDHGQLNPIALFFVFLGALIAFVGFIVAVVVGRQELDKSRL